MSEGILTALIGAFATITAAIAATVIGIWLSDRGKKPLRAVSAKSKKRRSDDKEAERQKADQQKSGAEAGRREEGRLKTGLEVAEPPGREQEEERQGGEEGQRALVEKNDQPGQGTTAPPTPETVRRIVYGPAHKSFRCKGANMSPREQLHTFVEQLNQQIRCLQNEEYAYSALHVYVAGVPEAWEFGAEDDFELREETGVLIVRDGPTDEAHNDNAEVPEHVFRLDTISVSELISEG